jgi:hypothetical protein
VGPKSVDGNARRQDGWVVAHSRRIAVLLTHTGLGAIIGFPMGVLLCIWSVISVVTAREQPIAISVLR